MPDNDRSTNVRSSWLRAAWGGWLSLCMPGLGQVYARSWHIGFSWIAIQAALLVIYRILTNFTPPTPVSVGIGLLCLAGWLLFHLGAAFDAFWRIRYRSAGSRPNWYKSTWLTFGGTIFLTFGIIFTIHLGSRPFSIHGMGQAPTLPAGTLVEIDFRGFPKVPARGDTVILDARRAPSVFVKRVVGLPGDIIQVRQGRLWLNHEPIPRSPDGDTVIRENGVNITAKRYIETLPGGRTYPIAQMGNFGYLNNTEEVTVPPDAVFVLGDNRDNSLDSRSPDFGTIPIDRLIGRATVIVYSRNVSDILSVVQ